MTEKLYGLDPDSGDFVDAPAFGDGQEVIVTKAGTKIVQYTGEHAGKTAPAVYFVFEGPELRQPYERTYTAGSGVVPNAEGTGFVGAPGAKSPGISKSSNAFILGRELKAAGVPLELLKSGDYSRFIGARFQLGSVPGASRDKRPIAVPVVFHGFGEAPAGVSPAVTPAAPSANVDNELTEIGLKIVAALLAQKPSWSKAELASAAGQIPAVAQHARKTEIITTLMNDAFYSAPGRPFTFANGTITAGGQVSL